MPLTRRQVLRAELAIAAMLNGPVPDSEGDIIDFLAREAGDYFSLSPVESSQFDRDQTLRYIRSLTSKEAIGLLCEMGCCPFDPAVMHPDRAERWQKFVGTRAAELHEECMTTE